MKSNWQQNNIGTTMYSVYLIIWKPRSPAACYVMVILYGELFLFEKVPGNKGTLLKGQKNMYVWQ